jgi:hypothetical protein
VKTFLFLIALACPLGVAAQAYKWVDDYGQVHYTQIPPTGKKAEAARAAAPAPGSPNQESLNQALTQAQRDEARKKQEAEKTAAAQAQRAQECKSWQEQLTYLDSTPPNRMMTTDEAGTPARVTEGQHEQRRNQLQQALREKCAG